ncbi:MAG: hypothetical protein JXR89_09185 [Deltaproteobacteria bacterium]|nr:hypothetical protein [Deltaproteobacteria bacterium]
MMMTTRRLALYLAIFTLPAMMFSLVPQPVAAALELRGKFLENGEPLAPGRSVAVVLRLYDDEFHGRLINEQQRPVLIETGSTVIKIDQIANPTGAGAAMPPAAQLWLEVESDGQVMTPRLNLDEIDGSFELAGGDLRLAESGLRLATCDGIEISDNGISAAGSGAYAGVISGANSDDDGYGVYGYASGSYGIGVRGLASNSGDIANYGGYFAAYGASGKGAYGYATGSAGRGVYGYASNSGEVANYGGYFSANGGSSRGVYGSGKAYDFYAGGTGTNYGPFTGAHEVCLAFAVGEARPGMLVALSGKVHKRLAEDGTPALSSTLPVVSLSRKAEDEAILGVFVKEARLPEDHWYQGGKDERFGIVNALGEGLMWVCETGGDIKAGNALVSSALPGYGQRQSDNLIRTCTVGKATETVSWDQVEETVTFAGKKVKVYLLAVIYTSG